VFLKIGDSGNDSQKVRMPALGYRGTTTYTEGGGAIVLAYVNFT
jgi:hypothetical protein